MSLLALSASKPAAAPRALAMRPQMHRHISGLRVVGSRSLAPRPILCRAVKDKTLVLDDVRSIIADQLGKDVEQVHPTSKFVDLNADSLDTVEIMLALEEKFDVSLDDENAEKLSTVQDAADLIVSQLK
uniref:Acyl carrier protein n=1 Tax=Helicosporidium sp. subsp. Simulium jonesii TaxID=145475 RepID=Q5YBE5_HELSJ|nr:plastid acyl carrier protein [Helicosporidium sp. ex Simulium jonesi]